MILYFDDSLRDWFPERVEVQANSPFDALSLIANQHPLKGKIPPIPVKFKEIMSYEAAHDSSLSGKSFTLTSTEVTPEMRYAGSGGRALGVVLIVVAVVLLVVTAGSSSVLSAALLDAGVSVSVASWIVTGISFLGSVLLAVGLQMVLAPRAKSTEFKKLGSYTFGAGQNTTAVGTTIPMIFGRCLASAQILSFNINSRSNPSGIDDPNTSAYFNGKADVNLPNINLAKFYGTVRAGDTTRILQQDNNANRTGTEFQ